MKTLIIKSISAIGVAGALLWIVACGQSGEVREDARKKAQPALPSEALIVEGKRQNSSVTAAEADTLGVPPEAKMQAMMDGYSAQTKSAMLEGGSIASRIRAPSQSLDRENYRHYDDNPVKQVAEAPVSTFSIDVDTGS